MFAAGCSQPMATSQGTFLATPAAVQTSAEFDEAVTLITDAKYAEAEVKLNRLLPLYKRSGDGRRTAETLYWLGFCSEKQGRIGTAIQLYQEVIKDYPDTPACPHATRHLEALTTARLPAGTP